MTRLNEDQVERILDLRRRKWSKQGIADELGCSLSTVSYRLLLEGEGERMPAPTLMKRRTDAPVRGGREVKPFTMAEDVMLLDAREAEVRWSQIGRKLNRKPHVCYQRMLTLMRHEARGSELWQAIEEARQVPPR
jgi:hypothetical protein